jgi:outer membrane protein
MRLMNMTIASLALVGTLYAEPTRASLGAGIWNESLSGTVSTKNSYGTMDTFNTDILGYSAQNQGYFWFDLWYPIPVLPNIRVEYAAVSFSGDSTQSFTYENDTFDVNAASTAQLNQYDIILYYNVVDNRQSGWINLDLGLDAKIMLASFKASGYTAQDPGTIVSIDEGQTFPVPMGYLNVRLQVPGTNFGISGEGKYASYKNSTAYDYLIKADIQLTDGWPVNIGLEAGYREMLADLDGDDFDIANNSMNVKIKGFFAGAVLHF